MQSLFNFRYHMFNPFFRKKVREITFVSVAIVAIAAMFILLFSMMTG